MVLAGGHIDEDHGPGGHVVGLPGVIVGEPGVVVVVLDQDEDEKIAPAVQGEVKKVGPAVQDREHLGLAGGHIDGDHGPGGHVVGVPGVVVGVPGQDEDKILYLLSKMRLRKLS